jgi:hypothetical protein
MAALAFEMAPSATGEVHALLTNGKPAQLVRCAIERAFPYLVKYTYLQLGHAVGDRR